MRLSTQRRGGFIKGCFMLCGLGFMFVVFIAAMSATKSGGVQSPSSVAPPHVIANPEPAGHSVKPRSATSDIKKKYTREEFTQLVTGRNREDVITLIGKPRSTQKSSDGIELWDYPGRTTDPVTGKTDDLAQLDFDGDRVASVTFFKY